MTFFEISALIYKLSSEINQSHPPALTNLKITTFRSPGSALTTYPFKLSPIFTALHGMQTRYSDENSICLSVRLSVRPSVTRVNCDMTVERSVQIYIPYERTFSLVY